MIKGHVPLREPTEFSGTNAYMTMPCHDQTFDSIKAWFKENALEGMKVVVREGYAGVNMYHIDEIDRISARTGRIHTRKYGAF